MSWFSKKWKQIKGWFTPSEPKQQGINIEKKGTNKGVPIIYGFMKKAPCIKVFAVTTDKSGGAKNEYLHFICVFSVGEIEEIGQLYFNDVAESQIDNKRYHVERFTGSATQNHCATLSTEFSQWKSTAKLKNVAYAYVRLKQNKDVNWWNGEPSISADIKGLKVFDPRDSQTKYSENIALCAYDYLTKADYGKGLTASKINTASFITAANFIETERTYTRTIYSTVYDTDFRQWEREPYGTVDETVTENLMSCNISLDPENTIKKNVETLLSGMRAILPETDGQYRIAIEKDDTPVFAFTSDNLKGAIQCQGGSQSDRYNQVIIRFRNTLTGEDDEAVFPSDDALHQSWKTADKGKLLLGEFDFDTINNKAEALQMGHVIAYRSRELLGAMFTGTPETLVVEAGDVVTLDSKILGWIGKPFRVESCDIDLKTGECSFQAIEHQNTIYPWAVGDVIEEFADTSFALPHNITTPSGFQFVNTGITADYLGKFIWDDLQDTNVSMYQVIVTNDADDTVVFSEETEQAFVHLPYLGQGDYTASLVAKNRLFVSDAAVLQFHIALPGIPTVTVDSISNNSVAMSATVGGAPSLATTFHWQFIGTTAVPFTGKIVKGDAYTYTGLLSETTYKFRCRTVNIAGESPWVETSATTGSSSTDVSNIGMEQLDENLSSIIGATDRNFTQLSDRVTEEEIRTLEHLNDEIEAEIVLQTHTVKIDSTESNISALNIQSSTHTTQLSQITHGTTGIYASALNYTSAGLGKWNGAIWQEGVYSEQIRNVRVQTADGGYAKVTELAEAFQDANGSLIARGGMLTDVNDRVNGFMTQNNGESSQFDIIASNFRVGDYVGGNPANAFNTYLYLNQDQMILENAWVRAETIVIGDGTTTYLNGKPTLANQPRVSIGNLGGVSQVSVRDAASRGVSVYGDGHIEITRGLAGQASLLFESAGQVASGLSVYAKTGTGAGLFKDGVGTFTGKHSYILPNNLSIGDVGKLFVQGELHKRMNINNAMFFGHESTTARNTLAIGAYAQHAFDEEDDVIENHQNGYINALGEGLLLVCSESGNIHEGQWLCSSSVAGHAMLQTDATTGEYEKYFTDFTVAKSSETVVWADEPDNQKLIAVYYKGG